MNAWTKILLSVSLVCYLAVSSIAAVHAFPMPMSQQSDMSDSIGSAEPITMPCHQMTGGSTEQPLESNSNSISVCEIFCAAMGNALSHEFAYVAPITSNSTEIDYIQPKFYKGDHSLEPHPPK